MSQRGRLGTSALPASRGPPPPPLLLLGLVVGMLLLLLLLATKRPPRIAGPSKDCWPLLPTWAALVTAAVGAAVD